MEAFKVRPLFHGKHGSVDFANQDAGSEEPHLGSRGDVSVDPPVADQFARSNGSLDDRIFSDLHPPVRVNLAFDPSVNSNRAGKASHTFEDTALSEKREALLPRPAALIPLSFDPHGSLHLPWA
jgi:hypothetical protein